MKSIYAHSVETDVKELAVSASSSIFKELFVDQFVAEQIWSQLERFDKHAFHRERRDVKVLETDFRLIQEDVEAAIESLCAEHNVEQSQVLVQTHLAEI